MVRLMCFFFYRGKPGFYRKLEVDSNAHHTPAGNTSRTVKRKENRNRS
jgi:hypothetical protein